MAGGLDIRIDIDDREIRTALNRLLRATGDLTPAMKNIGEYLVQATEERFNRQSDPDGQKWPEVAPATRARKKHPKVLTESHHLRGSIHPQADRHSVTVGTNVPYGAIHQFGFEGEVSIPAHERLIKVAFGKALKQPVRARIRPYTVRRNLPARPFLGLSEQDREEILAIIADHLDRAR